MAFLNRATNLLKQNASNASLFEAVRNISSSSKVFVGGISYSTDDMSLREAFSKYGEVVEARVVIDRNTGRSRGFAFVTYTSTEAASSAIQALDGQEIHGRQIRVNYATEKSRSGSFGGGFGSSDGFSFNGRHQGDGFRGSGSGSYSGGYDRYTGTDGFGSGNHYPSDCNRFDGGANFAGGGPIECDSNSSAGGSNYSGNHTGVSSPLHSQVGTWGTSQEQVIEGQGGIDGQLRNRG